MDSPDAFLVGGPTWIRTKEMPDSESGALPLGYTPMNGGGGRIRTTEPKELSYSQPRLASSLPPQLYLLRMVPTIGIEPTTY